MILYLEWLALHLVEDRIRRRSASSLFATTARIPMRSMRVPLYALPNATHERPLCASQLTIHPPHTPIGPNRSSAGRSWPHSRIKPDGVVGGGGPPHQQQRHEPGACPPSPSCSSRLRPPWGSQRPSSCPPGARPRRAGPSHGHNLSSNTASPRPRRWCAAGRPRRTRRVSSRAPRNIGAARI